MNLGNAFGNIPNAFRLVWAASPLMTLVMVGITLLEGLVPPAMVSSTAVRKSSWSAVGTRRLKKPCS